MQGTLLINKPVGWTSFDVVNYIRRIVSGLENKKPKSIKVGHAGTLDPFATGLLIILVGKEYTKRASEFSGLDKVYEIVMRLGETSATGDTEGNLTFVSDLQPKENELSETLDKFKGEIYQTPPNFSAIKINGQRAYKLARAGKEFKIEPRKITIHDIKLKKYNYPEAGIIADVSSGTYIRSLVEDIGDSLGTGAYTTELNRISIGRFNLKDSQLPEQLRADTIRQFIQS